MPVAPTAPVAPVGPCGPVGPVSPTAPVAPGLPCCAGGSRGTLRTGGSDVADETGRASGADGSCGAGDSCGPLRTGGSDAAGGTDGTRRTGGAGVPLWAGRSTRRSGGAGGACRSRQTRRADGSSPAGAVALDALQSLWTGRTAESGNAGFASSADRSPSSRPANGSTPAPSAVETTAVGVAGGSGRMRANAARERRRTAGRKWTSGAGQARLPENGERDDREQQHPPAPWTAHVSTCLSRFQARRRRIPNPLGGWGRRPGVAPVSPAG